MHSEGTSIYLADGKANDGHDNHGQTANKLLRAEYEKNSPQAGAGSTKAQQS